MLVMAGQSGRTISATTVKTATVAFAISKINKGLRIASIASLPLPRNQYRTESLRRDSAKWEFPMSPTETEAPNPGVTFESRSFRDRA